MAVSLAHLSWWTWSGKHQEPKPRIPQGPSLNSAMEADTLKFPLMKRTNMASSSKRVKRKWHGRKERKADIEFDMVVVSSDNGCFSGSESDDSDWSIGWLEPHGHEFQSDTETNNDDSFAVLVPCYRHKDDNVEEDLNLGTNFFGNLASTHDFYSAGSKNNIEQWLPSLQNS